VVTVALYLAAGLPSVAGCSGGSASDAGIDDARSEASPADAKAPIAIRCSEQELAANDKSDGGVLEITFNQGANPAQYQNRCATVKVGASVSFSGSFAQHPLEPAGGDVDSPIPHTTNNPENGRLVITMARPGTFGFQCEFHPILMFGALRVVP
jgi:plastocyanin